MGDQRLSQPASSTNHMHWGYSLKKKKKKKQATTHIQALLGYIPSITHSTARKATAAAAAAV